MLFLRSPIDGQKVGPSNPNLGQKANIYFRTSKPLSALSDVLISSFLGELPSLVTIRGRFTVESSPGLYRLPVKHSI